MNAEFPQEEMTDRQKNEIEYHRKHAEENAHILERPFSYEVLEDPSRRWWNAYWQMYAHLSTLDLKSKRVLVVGCGFGDDAIRLAKLGAKVHAFDLSTESLEIARALAQRESVEISFDRLPAEALSYDNGFFDVIVARDILHHVDIPKAMDEIDRVAKPGAILLINEIYSHSLTDRVRRSALVEGFLYKRMQRLIYGDQKPYITQDERKLSEVDVRNVSSHLGRIEFTKYFNFVVTRIVPDRWETASKMDRGFLAAAHPLGCFLAGRLLMCGRLAK